jgi:mono/diheme cytochrome c family protein
MVLLLIAVAILIAPLASAADGKAAYKSKCAVCHADDGGGNTPMGKKMAVRSLRSPEVQKQTDAVLTKVIADGKGKMPPFGKRLTADEIKAIVAHIRTFK